MSAVARIPTVVNNTKPIANFVTTFKDNFAENGPKKERVTIEGSNPIANTKKQFENLGLQNSAQMFGIQKYQ
jgi:hypothetical protein